MAWGLGRLHLGLGLGLVSMPVPLGHCPLGYPSQHPCPDAQPFQHILPALPPLPSLLLHLPPSLSFHPNSPPVLLTPLHPLLPRLLPSLPAHPLGQPPYHRATPSHHPAPPSPAAICPCLHYLPLPLTSQPPLTHGFCLPSSPTSGLAPPPSTHLPHSLAPPPPTPIRSPSFPHSPGVQGPVSPVSPCRNSQLTASRTRAPGGAWPMAISWLENDTSHVCVQPGACHASSALHSPLISLLFETESGT